MHKGDRLGETIEQHETARSAHKESASVDVRSGSLLTDSLAGVDKLSFSEHVDARGRLVEFHNKSWGYWPEPVDHGCITTLRPGVTKGWGLHVRTRDRYVLVTGEIQVDLYDIREDSTTYCRSQRLILSAHGDRGVTIPAGIWHALKNIGDAEAYLLNFKTPGYDHDSPDKLRLDLTSPLLPSTD